MESPTWKYTGTSEPERLAALICPLPFPELVRRLKEDMIVVCFHREPRTSDTSYSRAVFLRRRRPRPLRLVLQCAHWLSRSILRFPPEAGVHANRMLINELSPSLANWAIANHTDTERDWLVESLGQSIAKAWLAEEPLGLCAKCAGEWSASYVSELQLKTQGGSAPAIFTPLGAVRLQGSPRFASLVGS